MPLEAGKAVKGMSWRVWGRREGAEGEAHGEAEVPCAVQRAQWPLSSRRLLPFGNLY